MTMCFASYTVHLAGLLVLEMQAKLKQYVTVLLSSIRHQYSELCIMRKKHDALEHSQNLVLVGVQQQGPF
jgi:hypothetical protein